MEDQSVIDIKFKDVLARDLKDVIGKTLDGLVKDLASASKEALGVSGKLTNLGIIPQKDGRIGGIRFAVDSARRDDVAKAMRDRLGNLSYQSGVGSIASVESNAKMQAFSEPFIRLPNNDPAYAQSMFDYLKSVGGEVLWTEQFEDYIALRARVPHSHIQGNKLSTMQQLDERKREAFTLINDQMNAKRTAAAAEAIRKKDSGYISETDLESQEEKRRKLGVIAEDESKENVADKQDKKQFFTKSLAALSSIVAIVGKIASTLWKLAEQSVQTHYEAMSYGVNANDLQSFRNALENSGIPTSEASKAIGAVVGGLINPFTLDAGLVKKLAPVLGSDLAGTIKQMLSKKEDPFGALKIIMESARRQVNDPNSMWTIPKMVNQLGVFGPTFAGYMTWLKRQTGSDKMDFFDYMGYDPARYMNESAETGFQWKNLYGRTKHFLQNVGRSIISSGTYLPGAEGVYQRLGINPEDLSIEDLIEALKFENNPEINKYYHKFGTGYNRATGAPLYKGEMNKDLNTLENALEELKTLNTSFLMNPFKDTTGSLVETMAYGMNGGGFAGGGTMYNEINNIMDNSVSGGAGGKTSIDLHVTVGDRDAGTFPLLLDANNMITVNTWGNFG